MATLGSVYLHPPAAPQLLGETDGHIAQKGGKPVAHKRTIRRRRNEGETTRDAWLVKMTSTRSKYGKYENWCDDHMSEGTIRDDSYQTLPQY